MRTAMLAVALSIVVGAPATAAPGLEGARSHSAAAFAQAQFAPALRFAPGVVAEAVPGAAVAGETPFEDYLKEHTKVFQGGESRQAKGAPVKEMALASLKNRHLKTSLTYTLGGKPVWISGAFDRNQKAFVSVLEEGKAPRFFNVEEVLTKPVYMDIGTGKYKLSLSPDLSDQLESEIVLTNAANKKDQQRITLREMLTAVSEAGEPVNAGGQAYRVFFYDDIKDGASDASSQSFAFILIDANSEIHVFLVPAELVPSDKIAVFKMHENKAVGLQQAGGKLKIYDNP